MIFMVELVIVKKSLSSFFFWTIFWTTVFGQYFGQLFLDNVLDWIKKFDNFLYFSISDDIRVDYLLII